MTKPAVYIAGRYELRTILKHTSKMLHEHGFVITSRWLTEGEEEDPTATKNYELCGSVSNRDLQDIDAAEVFVLFTEPGVYSRGGRHTELGYAMAKGKKCFVIGGVENVFQAHSSVTRLSSFEAFLEIEW